MSALRIVVSESAGFCWGVERALELARRAGDGAAQPVDTLGPLIHNPAVVAGLVERGIGLIEDAESKTEGTVIIRSHGVAQDVLEGLAARGLEIVDATCTFVKAAQDKAARLAAEGYRVVILGEPAHPEVAGIRSRAGADPVVVESPGEIPAGLDGARVGVVVQTTQSPARLAEVVAALAPRVRELRVFNTICGATESRQRAAVGTAAAVDLVIVVGGRQSGNTTRLAELCATVQPRTFHIESADELEPGWLEGVLSVGVTAGASTPPDQIARVVERLKELSE